MTITKTSFRWLLVLTVVFMALGVWVHFMARASLPLEFQTYLRHQHTHPLSAQDKVLAACRGVFLLLSAICFVRLFFFQPFSRSLFVALILGGILFDPFLSLRVESGWSSFTDDCADLLVVLIFFVIYLSPLKDSFIRKR